MLNLRKEFLAMKIILLEFVVILLMNSELYLNMLYVNMLYMNLLYTNMLYMNFTGSFDIAWTIYKYFSHLIGYVLWQNKKNRTGIEFVTMYSHPQGKWHAVILQSAWTNRVTALLALWLKVQKFRFLPGRLPLVYMRERRVDLLSTSPSSHEKENVLLFFFFTSPYSLLIKRVLFKIWIRLFVLLWTHLLIIAWCSWSIFWDAGPLHTSPHFSYPRLAGDKEMPLACNPEFNTLPSYPFNDSP